MTRIRKKLPIGIQTFAKIREEDAYYYVDRFEFKVVELEPKGSVGCEATGCRVKPGMTGNSPLRHANNF